MSKNVKDIEQQLAHLQWRRSQNERAIRNALEKTKTMKQNDDMLRMSTHNSSESRHWKIVVENDEKTKPILLSDDQAFHLEVLDDKYNKKLQKDDERMKNVQKIKLARQRQIENVHTQSLASLQARTKVGE